MWTLVRCRSDKRLVHLCAAISSGGVFATRCSAMSQHRGWLAARSHTPELTAKPTPKKLKRPASAYQLVTEVTINIHMQRLQRTVSAADVESFTKNRYGRRGAVLEDTAAAAAAATELAASGFGVGADAPRKLPPRAKRLAAKTSLPGVGSARRSVASGSRRSFASGSSRRSVLSESRRSVMGGSRRSVMGESRRSVLGYQRGMSPTEGLLKMRNMAVDAPASRPNASPVGQRGASSRDNRPDAPITLLQTQYSSPKGQRGNRTASHQLKPSEQDPASAGSKAGYPDGSFRPVSAPPLSMQIASLETRLVDEMEAKAEQHARDLEAAREAAREAAEEAARLEAQRREALEAERKKNSRRQTSSDEAELTGEAELSRLAPASPAPAPASLQEPEQEPWSVSQSPSRRRPPSSPEGRLTQDETMAMFVQLQRRDSETKRQEARKAEVENERKQMKTVLSLTAKSNSTAGKMPTWWQERNESGPLRSSIDFPSKNWYPSRSEALKAASSRFDDRHEKHTRAAIEVLEHASRHLEPPLRPDPYEHAIVALRRDRIQQGERHHAYGLGSEYWTERQMRQAVGNVVSPRARWVARRVAFNQKSVWSLRAASSEGKAVLETETTMHKMIEHDWNLAIRYGLDEFIASATEESGEADIESAKNALLENGWFIYSAFDYLSGRGGDVLSIEPSAFARFLGEGEFADDKSSNCTAVLLADLYRQIKTQQKREGERPSPDSQASPPHDPLANTVDALSLLQSSLKTAVKRNTTTRRFSAAFSTSESAKRAVARAAANEAKELGSGEDTGDDINAFDHGLLPAPNGAAGWGAIKVSAAASSVARKLASASSMKDFASPKRSTSSKQAVSRTMCRHEWLQGIVRLAAMRYLLPGSRSVDRTANMADAIRKLIHEDMLLRMDSALSQSSNEFRREHCLHAQMERLLQTHEGSFRSLYSAFATEEGGLDGKAHMTIHEWLDFLKAFYVIDVDVPELSATYAFIWARMWVVDEHAKVSKHKLSGLTFEDFLEAFIRVAIQKGWPSHRMLESGGFSEHEVSDYMEKQRHDDPSAHQAKLEERSVRWDSAPYLPDTACVLNLLRWCAWCIKMSRLSADTKVKLGDPLVGKQLVTLHVREYFDYTRSAMAASRSFARGRQVNTS